MTSAPPTRDGVVVSTLCTSEDAIDHGTLCNLLQEGTQDHRVWETLYTTSPPCTTWPSAPQYLLSSYIACSQYYSSYRYTRYHSTTHMYIPVGSAMCSLCYAVGVLCYAVLVVLVLHVLHPLRTVSTSPSHVVCIHRGGGLLLMGPWLRRCSVQLAMYVDTTPW